MFKVGLTGGIACGKSFISSIFQAYGIKIIDADLIAREVVLPHSKTLNQLAQQFGEQILLDDGNLNRKSLREIVFTDPKKLALLNSIMHPAIHQRMNELVPIIAQGQDFPETYKQLLAQSKLLAKQASTPPPPHTETIPSLSASSNALDIDLANDYTTPLDPSLVIKEGTKPPYIIFDIPLLFENHLNAMVDRILVIDATYETQLTRIMHRDHCSLDNAKSIIAKQVSREYRCKHADDFIQTDILTVEEKRKKVLALHQKYTDLGQD